MSHTRLPSRQGPRPYNYLRGIGTIVGSAVFVLIAILVLGYMVYTVYTLTEFRESFLNTVYRPVDGLAISKSVEGYWRTDYPEQGDLYIHLTSHYSEAFLMSGIIVLWNDSSTTTFDKSSGDLTTSNVYIEVNTTRGTTTYNSFPVPLPPGSNMTIILRGYAAGRRPLAVTLAIAQPASRALEALHLPQG